MVQSLLPFLYYKRLFHRNTSDFVKLNCYPCFLSIIYRTRDIYCAQKMHQIMIKHPYVGQYWCTICAFIIKHTSTVQKEFNHIRAKIKVNVKYKRKPWINCIYVNIYEVNLWILASKFTRTQTPAQKFTEMFFLSGIFSMLNEKRIYFCNNLSIEWY